MIRELKFRQAIFHPVTELFVEWHYWGLIDGEFVGINTGWYSPIQAMENSQQYIGLTSTKDKDIYAGDILGGIYGGGYIWYCDKCKSMQLFTILEGCWACMGELCWAEIVKDNGKIEVIGTVWENPELLEVKE